MALLTNFYNDELYRYEKALKEYIEKSGDRSIYIDRNAFIRGGRKIESMSALRVTSNHDCSAFWKVFDNTPKICLKCGKEHFEFGRYCSLKCRADSIEYKTV